MTNALSAYIVLYMTTSVSKIYGMQKNE